jgi:hypothetical protein
VLMSGDILNVLFVPLTERLLSSAESGLAHPIHVAV